MSIQTHTASTCLHTRSLPPNVYTNAHCLHMSTHMLTASTCLHTRSLPPHVHTHILLHTHIATSHMLTYPWTYWLIHIVISIYAYLYPPHHKTHTLACWGAKIFRIKLPTHTSNHVSSHKVITVLIITNVKLELWWWSKVILTSTV